jgi:tungstate transport system substrate-binding protein
MPQRAIDRMPQGARHRVLLGVLLLSFGCSAKTENRVILASTTSTQDSGLFGVLIPAFERAHPEFRINVVAVGTGEALEMGKRKDADVLLVHAPAAESAFVVAGYGTNRRAVMHDDFVIVGPSSDPAQIRGLTSATEAFKRIAAVQAPFVSRGDDSGTEKKELAIWKRAGIKPAGAWYARAGQGMGEVLKMSSEKQAYTLTDRPSYLFMQKQLKLDLLAQGDPMLLNPYTVIEVVGARNAAGARAFDEWVTSGEGQAVIGSYGVDRFGKQLFIPDAKAKM